MKLASKMRKYYQLNPARKSQKGMQEVFPTVARNFGGRLKQAVTEHTSRKIMWRAGCILPLNLIKKCNAPGTHTAYRVRSLWLLLTSGKRPFRLPARYWKQTTALCDCCFFLTLKHEEDSREHFPEKPLIARNMSLIE